MKHGGKERFDDVLFIMYIFISDSLQVAIIIKVPSLKIELYLQHALDVWVNYCVE